ncbi:hypothetical protein ACP4OV_031975 [Aristida adscensionis]
MAQAHHGSEAVSLQDSANQTKIVSSHSNFGQSPFELWIDHPDVPRKNHMGVSKWLKETFFPHDQLVIILHGFDYLESDVIRSFFLGDHITYDVEHCQMIIVPVFWKRKWSCYFWDFKEKHITVLDPSMMSSSADKVEAIHGNLVYKLHAALFSCKKKFIRGWDCDEDGWTSSFPTHISVHSAFRHTGVYVVHARAFNRQQLNFQLAGPMQSKVYEFRSELLYFLLSMDGNQGYKHPHLNQKLHPLWN